MEFWRPARAGPDGGLRSRPGAHIVLATKRGRMPMQPLSRSRRRASEKSSTRKWTLSRLRFSSRYASLMGRARYASSSRFLVFAAPRQV